MNQSKSFIRNERIIEINNDSCKIFTDVRNGGVKREEKKRKKTRPCKEKFQIFKLSSSQKKLCIFFHTDFFYPEKTCQCTYLFFHDLDTETNFVIWD